MTQETRTRKIFHLVALPLIAACLATVLSFRIVERYSSLASLVDVVDSQRTVKMTEPIAPRKDIQVITFDNSTASKLGLGSYATELPRAEHAKLISLLDQAGAKVCLYDVMFDGDKPDDAALSSAISKLKTMKLTLATGTEDDAELDFKDGIASGSMYTLGVTNDYLSDNVRVAAACSERSDLAGLGIGGYAVLRNSKDDKQLVYAPVSATLQFFDIPLSAMHLEPRNSSLTADVLEWNLDEDLAIRARWTAKARPFRYWDFVEALAVLKDKDPVKRAVFKDQLVIVGHIGEGDLIPTAPFGTIPGVEFIAQMTNTAMQGLNAQIHRAPDAFAYPFSAVICFAGFLAARSRRWILAAPCLLGLIGLCFLTQRGLMTLANARLGVTSPLLALLACTLTALIAGRYWTDDVDLSPPPAADEATVMFLDLVGSTHLLHEIGRNWYQSIITQLLSRYSRIVTEHGGEIERDTGDGFIAIFRPNGGRLHALRCADACEPLIRATEEVAKSERLDLRVTIGFESGVVGGAYLQAGRRRVWSSSGSTVHLAQRLQSLCSQLGVTVAVGPVARRLISDERSCEFVSRQTVKGFDEKVDVCSML